MRLPTNEGFRGGLEYKAYEANFNPALGFINRSNISNAEANLGYMLRPASGYVQSLLMVLHVQHVDRLDTGALQTHGLRWRPLVLRNRTGDEFSFAYRTFTESIDRPFEISPGIVIPVGRFVSPTFGLPTRFQQPRTARIGLRYEF